MACLDLQKAIVAGVAFSIGLGMKHHNIFEDVLVGPWHGDGDCPYGLPGGDQPEGGSVEMEFLDWMSLRCE